MTKILTNSKYLVDMKSYEECPTFDLKLLESIYIYKLSPNLNNHNSSCPLNILN